MDKSKVKTLSDLVIESAACYGDKVFMKERAGSDVIEHSYNDLRDDSLRLVSFLRKIAGERIHAAVTGPTCYSYLVSYFGTVMSNDIIVPLDAQLGVENLIDHLQRSDSEVFFYDKRHAAMIDEIKKKCPKIHTFVAWTDTADGDSMYTLNGILADNNISDKKIAIDPASCSSILYTSGTTGKRLCFVTPI